MSMVFSRNRRCSKLPVLARDDAHRHSSRRRSHATSKQGVASLARHPLPMSSPRQRTVRQVAHPMAEEDLTSKRRRRLQKFLRAGDPTGTSRRRLAPTSPSITSGGSSRACNSLTALAIANLPFTFKLGVGQVIEGWDLAVSKMVPGEVASFTVRADYGYGWEGKPPNIPVDATLGFEIELLSWTPGVKPIADMSEAERREHGLERRKEGTSLLQAGKHAAAATAFTAGVESLSLLHASMSLRSPDASQLAEVVDALRSCLLNLSQCELKLEHWKDAADACTQVLALPGEGKNVKARFRRGVALAALERWEDAKDDLKAACLLDPKSREIREKYEGVRAAHAAHLRGQRDVYGGMFASG